METTILSGWENYYVIVGSAAGGLTGLTFVVIALVRDAGAVRMSGLRAYVSPTMVHFGGALALSAFLSMPHQHVPTLSGALLAGAIAGLIYSAFTIVHLRRTSGTAGYVPVREDWIWNVILPSLAYAALGAAGILIWGYPQWALYIVALVSLGLLFIGIRNAWDIAVWMTAQRGEAARTAATTDLTKQPPRDQG